MSDIKGDTYRVDILLQKLGLYKKGMKPEDVNRILQNGAIKYLAGVVDESDNTPVSYYNTEGLIIDFGELATYSATQATELQEIVGNYRKGLGCSITNSNFILMYYWRIYKPINQVEVKIDLKDISNGKYRQEISSVVYLILRQSAKRWKDFFLKCIMDSGEGEAILQGEKVARISFITTHSDGKQVELPTLEPNAMLKLACAFYKLKKDYPNIEWYCKGNVGKFYTCYSWTYDNYALTYKANELYLEECRERGISAYNQISVEAHQVKEAERIKRRVAGKLLLEELQIRVGQAVYFSVAPFRLACRDKSYEGVESAYQDEKTGKYEPFSCTAQIHPLTYGSVFLARVDNYNEEYLVLNVIYKKIDTTSSLKIPIPWEALLADFELCCGTTSEGTSPNFTRFEEGKQIKVEEFYKPILNTPILFTEANCFDLRNPTSHKTFFES